MVLCPPTGPPWTWLVPLSSIPQSCGAQRAARNNCWLMREGPKTTRSWGTAMAGRAAAAFFLFRGIPPVITSSFNAPSKLLFTASSFRAAAFSPTKSLLRPVAATRAAVAVSSSLQPCPSRTRPLSTCSPTLSSRIPAVPEPSACAWSCPAIACSSSSPWGCLSYSSRWLSPASSLPVSLRGGFWAGSTFGVAAKPSQSRGEPGNPD